MKVYLSKYYLREDEYAPYIRGQQGAYSLYFFILMILGTRLILVFQSFSPNDKSPASPSPGTIYLCSFSSGSMAAHHIFVF